MNDDMPSEREMRRLAAQVPRGGRQRHPPPDGHSIGDHHDDPDLVVGQLPYNSEWRTTT